MASAKIGDIVHVDHKGRRFFAEVRDIEQERKGAQRVLAINPLMQGISYRSVPHREVVDVYRKLNGGA